MSDVQSVTVQIHAPTGDDVGQVTTGYFVVDGGVLTMTDAAGEPVRTAHGSTFTHIIGNQDDVRAVAGILTKQVRLALRDETEFQERFRRPLRYGPP